MIPTLQDWQQALDIGKLEAAVLYPTRFMHIGQVGMSDFAVDLSRAYNDYLYDRFLRHESRLKGMAILPMQDVPAAVAELRRVVKDCGMVGAVLPADGLPRPLGHPEFHPVYEEASRLGCMLAVHSQNSLRNNDLFMWRGEAATLAHVWPQMRQFTNFVFSGVLGPVAGSEDRLFRSRLRLGALSDEQNGQSHGRAAAAGKTDRARANLFSVRRGDDYQPRFGIARR